jgi:hypothetical protein
MSFVICSAACTLARSRLSAWKRFASSELIIDLGMAYPPQTATFTLSFKYDRQTELTFDSLFHARPTVERTMLTDLYPGLGTPQG